ncbi:MAG: hypothetical protein Q4C67_07835, partial [Deinococcus sp.]|nr:hypothetical protein [Deinococcus sp.]
MTGFLGTSVFDEPPTNTPTAQPGGGGFLGTSIFAAPPAGTVTTTDGGTFVKRDPLTAANMDEATDILADNFHGFLQQHPTLTNIIGTVGKVVQPLAAAQQILFTGIKAGQDAFDGDDETNAWETMKRGGRSALSFATWGAYQAAGLQQGDPRAQAIWGYELWKKAGAPNWVARWGGTATDFLLDVPLVGAVGKAAKLGGLTAGLRIGENMARTFDSPAAYRAFAGNVVAAPFTTQPIRRLTEAVPRGIREAGRERFVSPILNQRRVPRNITQPVSPTLGQTWLNRNMGVPEEAVTAEQRKQATLAQYTVLSNEALAAQVEARKGLGFEDAQQLGILTGRLADESNWAKRAVLEGEIRALETRTGVQGAADRAIRSVNKGVQFDVFSAEKLSGSGLMSETALKQYQAGDKRHLRRMYAMYGERPDDQIRRLMERDAPAAVTFDRPKLEGLYSLTLNRQAKARPQFPTSARVAERTFNGAVVKADGNPVANALEGKATPGSVRSYPSQVRNDKGKPIDLLDPVADAERLVWRDVVEPLKVGTVDRGALDLPSQDMSHVRTLKNVLGEDAVQRVNGRWRVVGGVSDEFPVGHPDIQRIFGDLESQGLAANVTVQEKRFRRRVPNYFNPKDDSPLDLQREYAWRELEESGQVGALYLHSNEISAFMAGATEAEVNAVSRSMDRFPIRQQASRNGRGQDDWFPVDPSDPELKRLIDRAQGGGAALFDGVTGQPTFKTALQGDKLKANLPSPKEFAEQVEKAYTNPDIHPVEFLNGFFRERGMSEQHIMDVLDGIGKDWADRVGIQWRPSDQQVVRHFTRKAAEGGQGNPGGRGVGAVTTQRTEIDDAYADVLGQIEDF